MWSDNDVTLWPGESQTLRVTYPAADLHGAAPVISVSGWNAGKIDVAAPATATARAAERRAETAHGVVHISAR
ncbi:MAG TPA: hypothetical protein VHV74_19875 [Pseudonocardiaceae bacterium]|nr:hypothetical protein [Pseudonocardiaceae bacterium]